MRASIFFCERSSNNDRKLLSAEITSVPVEPKDLRTPGEFAALCMHGNLTQCHNWIYEKHCESRGKIGKSTMLSVHFGRSPAYTVMVKYYYP